MATSGGEEAAAALPAPGASATGADTTLGWEVAVRPLLSASYSAFEMKELPQLVASVIERYRAAAPAGRALGGGGEREVGPDLLHRLSRLLLRLRDPWSPPRLRGCPALED
ncbi:E3 ubiquitin-protein ligase UBR4 [Galemys pyrenaicus]|uniref:E3 ubiquitin-protein ligase UBR4 n=1 Tax=Galemys pyrenaicus TaxID=202257 RepID=A0A8J6A7E6_GALPY|nr:E3 ubiquitin-protein ligase UBR4 [Galemys pyrenaicus]